MMDLKYCKTMEAELAGLLLEPETASAEVRDHVAKCEGCRRELAELRAAMGLMDTWQAPAPNPYFLTRLNARMSEERQKAPAGWLARLRASLIDGRRRHMRPLAALAMTIVMFLGGGIYLGMTDWMQPAQPNAAVVRELQTLANNEQVLDTLESLSTPDDDGGDSLLQ